MVFGNEYGQNVINRELSCERIRNHQHLQSHLLCTHTYHLLVAHAVIDDWPVHANTISRFTAVARGHPHGPGAAGYRPTPDLSGCRKSICLFNELKSNIFGLVPDRG